MDNNRKIVADAKPLAQIQILMDSLLELGIARKAKIGQRFQFIQNDKRMSFLLIKGDCQIKRVGDLLILGNLNAPGIIGITDLMQEHSVILVQATTPIEYIYLPQDDFLSHVENHNLWKPVVFTLMHFIARLGIYTNSNIAISNYELIRNLLRTLIDEDFETRATVSAVKYIQERSSLSRSGIMKVLSELNTGGYIVIKRGLLIKINNLPKNY